MSPHQTRETGRAHAVAMVVCFASAGTYAAMPFVAAWQIREAVRLGDHATLSRKVDWPAVRQLLKSSLEERRKAVGELSDFAGQPRPITRFAGTWLAKHVDRSRLNACDASIARA